MKQRIITGAIALALFLPIVLLGGSVFTILVYIIAAVGLHEMLRMKGISLFSFAGLVSFLLLFLLLLPSSFAEEILTYTGHTKLEWLFVGVFLVLIYTVLVKNRFTFDDAAFVILSTLYVGIGFYYFIETRNEGLAYVIFALLIVWTTDSGAYFTGRKIGKRKLWPEISPNKTVEGFVGGIIWALITAFIIQWISPLTSSILVLIGITIVASIFGQLGDLVESAIKRHYNVKDSGNLLPGHGGILDRFDSILFVLPLLHFLHFI
ncbi:phosphatidate cytidylyltransferase [Paenisporosarcina quisquiliarum]|uniref:Phosphatidate cytidylyltransferase n=1 Tax=Psychrobacillus psychrodurans TaxID=126157 RepID=A0A9X3L7S0_9BACI|nr:phosphatidate cytidylyltransferase [Psychrobacillus psychrodurans]MCZ8532750.1 phosphatidate cytidylyltransferase [Psychrobacillus psychrodurans]SEM20820.1 phosphatidate cytidylyltransferase [Paenisporosarcina quisquiliarum]